MIGKKIAIAGSGAIGLYYGAKLAAAGCDVRFLMRSGLELAHRSGIRVHSESGPAHLARPNVAGFFVLDWPGGGRSHHPASAASSTGFAQSGVRASRAASSAAGHASRPR